MREVRNRWVESFFEKNRNVFANERVAQLWRYGFERVSPPAELAPFRSLEVDANGNLYARSVTSLPRRLPPSTGASRPRGGS